MKPRLQALLDEACKRARAWLPDLADCEPFDGLFGPRELRGRSIRSPAVLVALLGIGEAEAARFPEPPDSSGFGGSVGTVSAVARIGAFCVAGRPRPGQGVESEWARARAMAERVLVGVALDDWSVGFPVGPPTGLRVESLFAKDAGTGTGIVAVAWTQRLELVEPGTARPDRPLPAHLYRAIEPPPAKDAGDYDLLAPEGKS